MALSPEVTGSLITSGASLLGEGVFGKGARKAQKDLAKEQKKLVQLAQEEQRIKNQILAQGLREQDSALPFSASSSSRGGYPTSITPGDETSFSRKAQHPQFESAGLFSSDTAEGISIPILIVGAAFLFFLMK